ncbi:hypothetical protein [Cerasicoccus frondis]|uniref:hypothetical protein n=1 Tax=Cerasicoccus frondis TaxID=490090 RepID=UPI0028526EC1|nr:hypothetical protein [Cerasicoccus frondis]
MKTFRWTVPQPGTISDPDYQSRRPAPSNCPKLDCDRRTEIAHEIQQIENKRGWAYTQLILAAALLAITYHTWSDFEELSHAPAGVIIIVVIGVTNAAVGIAKIRELKLAKMMRELQSEIARLERKLAETDRH